MDERYWNELYGSRDQLFSGNPNGVLVTEVAGLKPGQALDVGCGEGADALWLAQQGWLVTAVDIARTALDRAAKLHRDITQAELDRPAKVHSDITRAEPNEAVGDASSTRTAGAVCWTQADLAATPPPARSFDLVSVQYFPLTKERPALDGLLAAVAPGGTLLVVGHDPADLPPEFNRDDYHWPAEIAAMLGDDWTVQVDETRKRVTPPPPGSGHVNDTVLRARRHGQAG
jgi:SAM-dependent methyltransferase